MKSGCLWAGASIFGIILLVLILNNHISIRMYLLLAILIAMYAFFASLVWKSGLKITIYFAGLFINFLLAFSIFHNYARDIFWFITAGSSLVYTVVVVFYIAIAESFKKKDDEKDRYPNK